MIRIEIKGMDAVKARLAGQAKQVRYAASRALNNTAFAINGEVKAEMQRTFKGGATPYALRAFRVEKATPATLTARVALREDAPAGGTKYAQALQHMFEGGRRHWKKVEGLLRGFGVIPPGMMAVPGERCPLDARGNIIKDQLKEVIAVVRSSIRNLRIYRRTGQGKAQKGIGYFVVLPGHKTRLHTGIWKRIETGATSVVQPIIMYVSRGTYRQAINLKQIGERVVAQRWQTEFDTELAKALSTAR